MDSHRTYIGAKLCRLIGQALEVKFVIKVSLGDKKASLPDKKVFLLISIIVRLSVCDGNTCSYAIIGYPIASQYLLFGIIIQENKVIVIWQFQSNENDLQNSKL